MAVVDVGFRPGFWIGRGKVLVDLASRSYSVVSLFVGEYGDVMDELFSSLNEYIVRGDVAGLAGFLDGLGAGELYGLVEAARDYVLGIVGGSGISRLFKVLRRRYPWVPELRDPYKAFLYLACLMRLSHLYTGNGMARVASIFSYAATRILEVMENRGVDEAARMALYFYSGGLLVLNGEIDKGLSLLGWGMRRYLRVKPLHEASIAEKPGVWRAILEINYYLDISPLVDGRILDELGLPEYVDGLRR